MDVSYWQSRFNGARRVLASEQAESTRSRAPRVLDRDSPAPTTVRLGGFGKPAADAPPPPASGDSI
jgi:hypothetical protein